MKMSMKAAAALAALIMLAGAGAHAAKAGRWSFQSRNDFAKFKSNGFEIDPSGTIKPGVSTKAYPLPVEFAWSILEVGGDVLIGTADDARIIQVSGLDRDEPLIEDAWRGDGLIVYALAANLRGDVFAGVSPTGKVARLGRTENGLETVEEIQLPDSYVWKIVPRDDGIWIATGSGQPGRGGSIYRWRDSRVDKVFTSSDEHVMSLLSDGDRLVAGTQGRSGYVLQLTRLERDTPVAAILFDPPQDEISDLAIDSAGYVYAAALTNASRGQRNQVQSQPRPPAEEEESSGEEEEGEAPSPSPVPAPTSSASVMIYRIDRGGKAEAWMQSRSTVRSIVMSRRGLFAAATDLGAVYRVDGQSKSTLVLSIDEKPILAMSENCLVTGKPSVLHKIVRSDESAYCRSQVLEAEGPASWGVVTFESDGDWEIRTRSGNSAAPDATWSAWSLPIRVSGGRIESPSSQYLQYEIRHRGRNQSDFFRQAAITYQVFNRPPRLTDLSASSVSFQQRDMQQYARGGPFGQLIGQFAQAARNISNQQQAQGGGSSAFAELMSIFAGSYSIAWAGEDPDRDRLSYKIELIDDASSETVPIVANYFGTSYILNASLYPDGYYRVRVTVDDKLDNDEENLHSASMTTERLLIDNTPPEVVATTERTDAGVIISGTVLDRLGRITALHMLDAAGKWQTLKPEDGICDQSEETFRIIRTGGAAGKTIVVKAMDQSGNVGYAKIRY